jgi:hypothetical protein
VKTACYAAPASPMPVSTWPASPAARRPPVVTSILDDAGDVARGERLLRFAAAHGLPIGSIADLIHHRMLTDDSIRAGVASDLDALWPLQALQVPR